MPDGLNCRFTGEATRRHGADVIAAMPCRGGEWMAGGNLTASAAVTGGDGRHLRCTPGAANDTGRGAVDAGYSRPQDAATALPDAAAGAGAGRAGRRQLSFAVEEYYRSQPPPPATVTRRR